MGVSCMARSSAMVKRILKRGSMCVLCTKPDDLFISCSTVSMKKLPRNTSYDYYLVSLSIGSYFVPGNDIGQYAH